MAVTTTTSLGVLFIVVALSFASCAGGRRGPAEHQVRQMRPTRGFNEMELSVARNFGKRAVNMHVVNRYDILKHRLRLEDYILIDCSILLEWLALESKMKNLRQRGNLPLSLESVRNIEDNAPSDGVLLDE